MTREEEKTNKHRIGRSNKKNKSSMVDVIKMHQIRLYTKNHYKSLRKGRCPSREMGKIFD